MHKRIALMAVVVRVAGMRVIVMLVLTVVVVLVGVRMCVIVRVIATV